ncbi:hypothetical protein [Parvularcula maris]|uniref:Uncharacterized protein n=1 Tax=Parvularcula maris TaxID=2965077 RepID=A0A9X2L9S7_9PROT|nr:hypothetical protein [Parvularcula maris]MCQ8185734.1 hypothetical protein [Parvularcula maris]
MTSASPNRLKDIVRDHAPSIAQALGGPFAGAAVRLLSRAVLGKEEGSEEELAAALGAADPALAAKVHEAGLAFDRAVLELSLKSEEVAASDRADARAREIALRDRIPGFLGAVVLTGFFCVLGMMLISEIPEGAETEFSIMLGALSTMAAAVMNYYFGSSASSREKTHLLSAGLPGRGARR